jgi:hypothetical protein
MQAGPHLEILEVSDKEFRLPSVQHPKIIQQPVQVEEPPVQVKRQP